MSLEKFQILHRLTGLIVTIFVLFFAISGIFLNHSNQLQLDKRYINFQWLLDWYEIKPTKPPVSYQAGNVWLSLIDTRLYFNDLELQERGDALLGIVNVDGILIVALKDTLLLLSEDGKLIEKVTGVDGVPDGIRNIGKLDDDQFIISAVDGYYTNDTDIGSWQRLSESNNGWSTPGDLPVAYYEQIMTLFRGQGLTLERVIIDFHSGRLYGRWSMVIVDIVSILLIFSAISGLWMWYKKKKIMAEYE